MSPTITSAPRPRNVKAENGSLNVRFSSRRIAIATSSAWGSHDAASERKWMPAQLTVVKYWKSYGVTGRGGVIAEREFQIWLDWMVKEGSLKPGQLSRAELYDNRFNPFAAEATAAPVR